MKMYEKLGKLGEGTHGTVFKAKNRTTKEIVAIKSFNLDEKIGVPVSALRELCMLKQLSHPNIVKLLDMVHDTTKEVSSYDRPPVIILVYEYCNQDLKHYCDSIAACGRQIEPSVVRCHR